MGRYWSDEPKKITIDLGGVTTPEQLRAILARHFHTWPDVREMSCTFSLANQECPYHLALLHWAEFQSRMPRYARRVKRVLDRYSRWHPHALVIQYGSPESPLDSANTQQPQSESPLRDASREDVQD
jgi:hypothetical protein